MTHRTWGKGSPAAPAGPHPRCPHPAAGPTALQPVPRKRRYRGGRCCCHDAFPLPSPRAPHGPRPAPDGRTHRGPDRLVRRDRRPPALGAVPRRRVLAYGGPPDRCRPGRLTVVGIGDSVTAGTACDCTDFVHRYAAQVPASAGGPARAVNLGVGGLTSAQLLSELGAGGAMSQQVASADVVAGDDRRQRPRARCRTPGRPPAAPPRAPPPPCRPSPATSPAIVDRARALRAGHPTAILVTDYWNVFEDGDVASAGRGAGATSPGATACPGS